MFWNVASALDEISAQMVWWYCAVAHFRGSINCKNCALLAAKLLFHSSFFTHSINQGWENLFNGKVICRKPKTLASLKTSCSVNTNMVNNASSP